MGRFFVVTNADTSISATVFMGKFKTLGPKKAEYDGVKMVEVEDENGEVKTVPNRPYKMRTQRWPNL